MPTDADFNVALSVLKLRWYRLNVFRSTLISLATPAKPIGLFSRLNCAAYRSTKFKITIECRSRDVSLVAWVTRDTSCDYRQYPDWRQYSIWPARCVRTAALKSSRAGSSSLFAELHRVAESRSALSTASVSLVSRGEIVSV